MGKAVIFCAPSGAGKTTIVKHLVQKIPTLKFSVSATTRSPRAGLEVEGRDYYFMSADDFMKKEKNGELYEWQEVYKGTYYGTLKSEVERIWADGNHVIFDIDVVGGVNLKKILGEKALAVFVSVENVGVLLERLENRKTESPESLEKRIGKAKTEMKFSTEFDYVLINRNLCEAFVEAERVVNDFLR